MQQENKKKFSIFKLLLGIMVGVLAVLGIIFVIIMLLPTDEEYIEEDSDTIEEMIENAEEGGGKPASGGFTEKSKVSTVTDAKSGTIMVYMNGSDLESDAGDATEDISEMLASGIGENVNVIIQTMGTREWQNYGIASDRSQTYRIKNGQLELIRDDLGQLECTDPDTLSEFIGFCKNNYPAERYMLVFWNHGGGPVYGFGYDEWGDPSDGLTIADMSEALSEHKDIRFDFIGMDCCIMGSLETCYAFAPYCDYALLSEDFESGLGWSYTPWMKKIEENPGISTPLLGKYVIDSVIEDNANSDRGSSACMALFNESAIMDLFNSWKEYAYQNEEALLNTNYSRIHEAKSGGRSEWDNDGSDVTISDYYISDMLALVEDVDNKSDAAENLMLYLKSSVAYYGHSSDKNELTGMAVSLPYGDGDFYEELKYIYSSIDMDEEYINWLKKFVTAGGGSDYHDYGEFEQGWDGWSDYEEQYENDEANDDWKYDYNSELWYIYEGDMLYLYDDTTDMLYCYDEAEGIMYYYDDKTDEWYESE